MAARLSRVAAVLIVSATVGASLSVAPAALAGHGPGPSAHQVAAGRAAVARREAEVRAAAAAVARTTQRLSTLAATAEQAVEAFDKARLEEQSAQQAVTAATMVLSIAARRVQTAQTVVNQFAVQAYMSAGISGVEAVLSADGPRAIFDRVDALEAIATSHDRATQTLDAARVYSLSVQRSARSALRRASAATAAADQARSKAESAVAQQRRLVSTLQTRQHQLRTLLVQARRHASALERARLAAIARARAAAAARRLQAAAARARQIADGGGAVGAVAGTISAATGLAAVRAAESQIGKPYVWGAAGPDSYDCSGLTMWSYAQVGVQLQHWTGFQWQEGAHISTRALRPGDLVFFATDTRDPNTIHHVGMYIGNGEMVEAPYTGANVRISSAWRPDLIGAIRPYR